MRNRIGILLAFVLVLPGIASVARGETVADECFTDVSGTPLLGEPAASCDADGTFDVAARWAAPLDGGSVGVGHAEAAAVFSKTVDASGLSVAEVRVTVRFDEATAMVEPWLGQRHAAGQIEIDLPLCGGCENASYSRTLMKTDYGTDAFGPGEQVFVFHATAPAGHTFYEPVPLAIGLRATTHGPATAGRAEAVLRGTLTAVTVGPPSPGLPRCSTETHEDDGILGYATATAWCDPSDSFGTSLHASSITTEGVTASRISFSVTRTLAAPAAFAVFTVDYTITRADIARGHGFTNVRIIANAWAPSVRGGYESRGLGYSADDVGPGRFRIVIEPASGTMLPAGDYRVGFSIESSAYRGYLPSDDARVDVEGSLDSVTLQGV